MGTVKSVSGSSFVISGFGPSTTKTTVKTTSATTYLKRQTATASAVTTGRCISAFGQQATNAVDAFAVTISTPQNGTCTAVASALGGFGSGFGGFGGAPGGGSGGPGGTSNG